MSLPAASLVYVHGFTMMNSLSKAISKKTDIDMKF